VAWLQRRARKATAQNLHSNVGYELGGDGGRTLKAGALRCHAAGRIVSRMENQINVRVEPELRERLEALARAEDRPLSSLVRRVLRAEAARREQPGEAAA
jgi:hypothetical protein